MEKSLAASAADFGPNARLSDHPVPARHEELFEDEAAPGIVEIRGGDVTVGRPRIGELPGGVRLELVEHPRHQVDGRVHVREFLQDRGHPEVVLDGVEPHPREHRGPRGHVDVARLVLVPQ